MREQAKKSKIGLLCEVTNGNLGNAAFEAAAVQHLLGYYPDAKFYVCSINSLETFKSQGVKLFPINRGAYRMAYAAQQAIPVQETAASDQVLPGPRTPSLRDWLRKIPFALSVIGEIRRMRRKLDPVTDEIAFWAWSYRFVKDFQLLILCGGGQLSDWWGGPWAHPYRLFMWATLARWAGVRLVVLNVAVELVSSPLSRWFLKRVLQNASYRSFRDENSKDAVEAWGVSGNNHVYPDLAFSLEIPEVQRIEPRRGAARVIGISPMAYCDPRVWPIKDATAYQKYLETLAAFARAVIRQGYTVMLFASQVRMDEPVLHDLRELVVKEDANLADRILKPDVHSVDDFLFLMPKLDLVVASRMHGLLLAQLMGTPVLAISYDSKVNNLMAGLELTEFCLDIRKIEMPFLMERFAALEAGREAVATKLRIRVAAYREALQSQYESVFGS